MFRIGLSKYRPQTNTIENPTFLQNQWINWSSVTVIVFDFKTSPNYLSNFSLNFNRCQTPNSTTGKKYKLRLQPRPSVVFFFKDIVFRKTNLFLESQIELARPLLFMDLNRKKIFLGQQRLCFLFCNLEEIVLFLDEIRLYWIQKGFFRTEHFLLKKSFRYYMVPKSIWISSQKIHLIQITLKEVYSLLKF